MNQLNLVHTLFINGIVTGYGLDGRGSNLSRSSGFFCTQPPIQWVPGVKRATREADNFHLVLRSKNCGHIPLFPHYAFMSWWLINWTQGQLYVLLHNAEF
jgi:hypothetical protein